MKQHFSRNILLFAILLTLFAGYSIPASGRMLYGYEITEHAVKERTRTELKLARAKHPFYNRQHASNYIVQLEQPHVYNNRAFDFYLVLGLVTILAFLRLAHPQYFRNLLKAFGNTAVSARQLKDQLQQNSAANLGMNLFFCLSGGVYAFYATRYLSGNIFRTAYPPGIILMFAILAFAVIYSIRYLSLRFAGWVFQIDTATENYAFNVFLVNKILSIVLLPFIIIMALGQGQWVQVSLFLSLVIIALSFLNRYARSQSALSSFVRFSKFHFFMYLCASELLPLAMLLKLLSKWLLQ